MKARKIVTALSVGVMLFSYSLPTVQAFAVEGSDVAQELLEKSGQPSSTYQDGTGITYYNGDSPDFQYSPTKFVKDLLTQKYLTNEEKERIEDEVAQRIAYNKNPENTGSQITSPVRAGESDGTSVTEAWTKLGMMIQEMKGPKQTGNPANEIRSGMWYNTVKHFRNLDEYNEHAIDKYGKYEYAWRTSGVKHQTSKKSAVKEIEGKIADYYKHHLGTQDRSKIISSLQNNSAVNQEVDEDVFYNLVTVHKKGDDYGSKGHYQAFAVLFHDFKISPIIEKNAVNYGENASEQIEKSPSIPVGSNVINRTNQVINTEQAISESKSESVTNSISGSQRFELGVTIGREAGVKVGEIFSAKVSTSISTSAAIEKGWSNEESATLESSLSSSVNVDMPPYTRILMEQNKSIEERKNTYTVPVSLSYSTTIIEYNLDVEDQNGDPSSRVLAKFSGDAAKDLEKRAITNKEFSDPDNIDWKNFKLKDLKLTSNEENEEKFMPYMLHEPKVFLERATNWVSNFRPMNVEGGSIAYKLDTVNSEIKGLVPIYPLYTIEQPDDLTDLEMTKGDTMPVNTIPLDGKNKDNGDYYNFDASAGHWAIVDEQGEKVNSSAATLDENNLTGSVKLKALEAGEFYLKYFIDEDHYQQDYTDDVADDFVLNSDLKKSAVIKVNVVEEPFAGNVDLNWRQEGTTVVAKDSVNLNSLIKVMVTDATGKEVGRSFDWETKELNAMQEDGTGNVFFAEPGTYHVRAKISDDSYSDWLPVTVTEARQLNTIVLPTLQEGFFPTNVDAENPVTVDLASLATNAQYKDQYEADFAFDEDYWMVSVNGEAATRLEGNALTISEPGDYKITREALDGSVRSQELAFTVIETPRLDAITLGQANTALIEGQSFDLSTLDLQSLDQHGEAFAGIDPAEITFTLAEGSHPASITDAELTTEEGVLKDGTTGNILVKAVHVATGIESAPITISVAQQAAAKTVTAKVKKQHGQYIEKGKAIAINDILASTVKDQYGKAFAGEVEWVSSDPSKVKIQNGKVTGLVANAKVNVTAKVGNAKSAPIALTVRTLQGDAVKNGQYATIQTKGYAVTSDFKGTKKTTSDKLLHKTYQVRHHYNHVDGQRYYSLHDSKGTFIGYVNAKAAKLSVGVEGAKYADSGYVSISKNGYYVLSHLIGKNKMTTNSVLWNTYKVTARYQHFDGDTYYAIADGKNKHVGYVNAKAVSKGKVAEGVKHNKKQYITFTKNYGLMKKFGSASTSNTKNMINKSYKVKSLHKHVNGESYYGVYDWADNFKGYVNAKAGKITTGAQGVAHKEKRYVTITNKCYNTWSSFSWKKRKSASSIYGKTYQVKVKYNHANGETYYSLYDKKGNWHGYINAKAAKTGKGAQGVYQKYGKKVKITKTCCNVYSNFNWRKKTDIKKLKGQVFTAKGKYVHLNGNTYYSLYNAKGKWMGYVNAHTVSNVK